MRFKTDVGHTCILLLLIPFPGIGQTLCENGFAGIYPCENVDLLYHVPPDSIGGASTNEVWGWTDPVEQTEYVLLGMSTGVGFFEISDPAAPIYLGILPTHSSNSSWRTLRTFDHYLFVSSEAPDHGMQVFDLHHLLSAAPPQTFAEDAWYGGFGKCHTLAIDEETGYLFACGTNTYAGGLHIVNIQDPLNPTIAGGYDMEGYTHEVQVITYNGPDQDHIGKTIVFCFNGTGSDPFVIIDATDPSEIEEIAAADYPLSNYCHQGWLTPDGGYMLMDDETDEVFEGFTHTRTLIWDLHDLDNPLFMGQHDGSTEAIDHNQYILGNLSYQSNYTAGLQIMDVSEIADTTLRQVAYFDHYPVTNATSYDGQWMNYPYFQSGVIPCTDIGNGLFLVKPNFIHAEYEESICATEQVVLSVILADGFPGPYSVSFQNLDENVVVNYTTENLAAPDTLLITFSNLMEVEGDLNFQVIISGMHNTYSRSVTIDLISPQTWYADNDQDGFGNSEEIVTDCAQPSLYAAMGGDCNDEDPWVYPGAPGTNDNVDNNCNQIIDADEADLCGDLDGDGIITINDLFIFTGANGCTGDCIGDINNDGMVSIFDLLILISDFGEECD